MLRLLIGGLCSIAHVYAGDTQSWVVVNKTLGKVKQARFDVYGEGRLRDDVAQTGLFVFGPRMSLPLNQMFTLSSTVNFFNVRREDSYAKSVRYDLGLSFKLKRSGSWRINQRLKYEYLDRDEGVDVPRLRARLQVSRPLSGKQLTGWYSTAEWFHETKADRFTQFRLVPIGLKFSLSKRVDLGAHYLIQAVRSRFQNHVLVSSFQF